MNNIKKWLLNCGLFDTLIRRRYLYLWRKKNCFNHTIPINFPPIDIIDIGRGTYGKIHVLNITKDAKLSIGSYCSIADNVTFLLSVDHPTSHISTYPFKAMFGGEKEAVTKGDISVGDDVWIGFGATILSGVKIGQGAIIAAGAVVTKEVPPYAIVAGVPAKVTRFRFEDVVINQLLLINWSKIDEKFVKKHFLELYSNVYSNNVESLIYEFPKF